MSKEETKEDLANMDEILKFLEMEIKTFEDLFDELIGIICYDIFNPYQYVLFR